VQRQEPVEERPVKLPEPALLTYNSAPAIEHQLPGGDDQ
jgi:hypothetical protein